MLALDDTDPRRPGRRGGLRGPVARRRQGPVCQSDRQERSARRSPRCRSASRASDAAGQQRHHLPPGERRRRRGVSDHARHPGQRPSPKRGAPPALAGALGARRPGDPLRARVGPGGKKLSKRGACVASLREEGIPSDDARISRRVRHPAARRARSGPDPVARGRRHRRFRTRGNRHGGWRSDAVPRRSAGRASLGEARDLARWILAAPGACLAAGARRSSASASFGSGAATRAAEGIVRELKAVGGHPARGAARADRAGQRPRAVVGARRAAAGRDAPGGSMRLFEHLLEVARRTAARSPGPVRMYMSAVRPSTRARTSGMRGQFGSRDVAALVAARERLRGVPRPQHHRRQRQDLRGGPGGDGDLAERATAW